MHMTINLSAYMQAYANIMILPIFYVRGHFKAMIILKLSMLFNF